MALKMMGGYDGGDDDDDNVDDRYGRGCKKKLLSYT